MWCVALACFNFATKEHDFFISECGGTTRAFDIETCVVLDGLNLSHKNVLVLIQWVVIVATHSFISIVQIVIIMSVHKNIWVSCDIQICTARVVGRHLRFVRLRRALHLFTVVDDHVVRCDYIVVGHSSLFSMQSLLSASEFWISDKFHVISQFVWTVTLGFRTFVSLSEKSVSHLSASMWTVYPFFSRMIRRWVANDVLPQAHLTCV